VAAATTAIVVIAALTVPPLFRSDSNVLTGHTDYIYDMAFSPDGTTLATGSADETVRVWDVRDDRHPSKVLNHPYLVNAVAFAPDGTLATGCDDHIVRLWDVQSGEVVDAIETSHDEGIDDLAISPDGSMLATAGEDGTVGLWELVEPVRQLATIPHSTQVYEVEFSPDGTLLASLTDDGLVQLWNVVELVENERARREAEEAGEEWSGDEVTPLRLEHEPDVWGIAFSPYGEVLATIDEHGIVRLWDVATGSLREDNALSHGAPAGALAFSPDSTLLATGGWDDTVTLWDAAPPDYRADQVGDTLFGHTNTVYTVAFSPDGKLLASAGQDHTVRLWDVAAARNS
jgi:WD40 repeat protein